VDVLACPFGGRLQLIAFIAEATVAKRILDHLGLDYRGPQVARAQAPPDMFDPGPSYDGADFAFPDLDGPRRPGPTSPQRRPAAP